MKFELSFSLFQLKASKERTPGAPPPIVPVPVPVRTPSPPVTSTSTPHREPTPRRDPTPSPPAAPVSDPPDDEDDGTFYVDFNYNFYRVIGVI